MNDMTRTEQHAAARHKRITGSRAGKIMTGGPVGWDTLSDLLHSEEPEPFYSLENTPDMPQQMRRGLEYEPMGRGEFFFRHDEYELEQPMFCIPGNEDYYDEETGVRVFKGDTSDKDLWPWIGVSVDAIPLEIKVPAMETHLAWKEVGILPLEHLPQCALSLLVTGADHWWFSSFCPELKGDDRFFEIKLEREEIYLDYMRVKIRQFLKGHLEHKVFARPAIEQEVISVSEFPVVNFGITDQAIDVLIEQYGGMEAPTTTAEYAVTKAAQIDMRNRRTGVDKIYKKVTDDARDYIAGVKTEQKRLIGLMEPTETRLKSLRTAWEDEQQRLKDEEIAREEQRVATIRELIDWLNVGAMEGLRGLTSEQINTQLVTFKDTKVTEEIYQEFFTEAENAKTAMMVKAVAYREEIFGQEQESARVAKEQKDLRERNAQLERENKERQEREAEENRERQEREAAEQEERDRAKAVDRQISVIGESLLNAMDGTLADTKKILFSLNQMHDSRLILFGDKWEQAGVLLNKTIKAVQNIVASKQAELDAIEAEKPEPAPVEETKPEVEPVLNDVAETFTPLSTLDIYTHEILESAEYIRENDEWLGEEDRELVVRLSVEIRSLSDDILQRIEDNDD